MPAVAPRRRPKPSTEPEERPRRLENLDAKQLFEPGGATLEARIATVWSELVESGAAECFVCHGSLRAGCGCVNCGAQLS
ncbi:MAG: hypothetical protein WKF62_08605 [Solirubrobacterales bacterium]